MAQKTDIRLRRSDTAGKIPTSANLSDGELAINTNSGALYFKKSDGTIITVHDNTILHIDSDTTVDSETGTAPKIGIGTTSPSFKLDVVGDGRFSGQNNLLYLDSGATGSPQIQFRQGTTRKSYVRYENSRTTFDIVNEFGNVALWTGSSGSEIERLTVDTSGNVGIGTTSPNARLEVKASAPTLKVAANERTTAGQSNTTLTLESQARESTNNRYSRYNFIVDPNTDFGHASLQIHYLNDGVDYGERLRIDSSGNLGIGTVSPERKLHVEADGQLVVAKFESGNSGGALIDIENDATLASNAGAYAGLRFYNDSGFEMALTHITESSGNGYVQIGTTWASGGEKLVVHSSGNVGIGTTSPSSSLHVHSTNYTAATFERNQASTNYGVSIDLKNSEDNIFNLACEGTEDFNIGYTPSGGSKTNLFTLTSSGNVGIGTTSPAQLLDVDGVARFGTSTYRITLDGNSSGGYFKIGTTSNDDSLANFGAFSSSFVLDTTQVNGFVFRHNGAEKMRLNSSGNLGIGTTSPSEKLEVRDGDITTRDSTNTNYAQLNRYTGLTLKGNGTGSRGVQTPNTDALTLGTNNTERVRIEAGGDVGIGRSDPGRKLDILDSGDVNGEIIKIEGGANYGAVITYHRGTSYSWEAGIGGGSSQDANIPASYWGVGERGASGRPARFLIAHTSGNVGIGVAPQTSGSTRLRIAGTGDPHIRIEDSDGTNQYVNLGHNGGDSTYVSRNGASHGTHSFYSYNGTSSTLRFKLNANGTASFNNAFTLPATIGSAGQVLKVPSTGSTLVWADDTGGSGSADSLTDLDGDTLIQVEESADEDVIRFDVAGSEIATMTNDGVILNDGYNFEGDVVGATKFKAQAGEALTIGDVVYISGISGNTVIVSKADADDSAKMPAFGLAGSTVSLNAAVEIVTFGTLLGVDTSTPSFALGEELYVSTTAGALTNSAPTGSSSLIQKIGKVTRVDASAGSIKVMGAGRTNATPNLDEGRLFIGNSSNQSVQGDDTLYVDMANSRVGINTTNPTYKLHVGGSGKSYLPGGIQLDSTNRIDFGNGNQYITGANDTSLTLATNGSASLTVLDSGDVGIGKNPSYKLDVSGSINATYSATNANVIGMHNGASGEGWIRPFSNGGDFEFNVKYPGGDSDYIFYVNDSTELLRIKESGNVGIGTSSPNNALDVVGNISLTGNVIVPTGKGLKSSGEFLNLESTRYLRYKKTGDSHNMLSIDGTNDTVTFSTTGSSDVVIDNSGDTTFSNNVTVTGNLTVDGTTTTLNTATLDVEDKNITLNYSTGDSSASADGAGITIQDAVDASTDASLTWNATDDNFEISHGLDFGDNSKVRFGASNDLQIYHDGSTSNINDVGTGILQLTTNGEAIQLYDSVNSTLMARFNVGGNITLRHNGSTKFQTTSTGIDVTGTVTSDGLTVDGNTSSQTYRSSRTDGDVYIQATTDTDFVKIGTQTKINALLVDGSGDISFYEDTGTTAKFFWDASAERLGIGTTSPSFPLHVATDGNTIAKYETSLTSDLAIQLSNSQGSMFFGLGGGEEFAVATDADLNGSNNLFAIKQTGNVGIGDTSPSSKLHVVGAVQNASIQDYGIAAFENTNLEGLTIGYDADGNHSFMYSREVGVSSRGLRLNGSIYISSYDNNVGIGTGTNALNNKLDVNGTISAIGGLRMGSQTSGEGILRFGGATGQGVGITTGSFSSANIRLFVAHPNDGGGVGIGTTTPLAKLQVEEYGIDTTETTTSATTQVAIHTFAATDFRSARFTIQVTNSTDSTYHTSEILLVHDGTTAYITEFGEIHTGTAEEATFDADISSGNVRLLATPASTDSMEFKIVCHSVTV